jgi:CTP synthase
LGKTVQVIPHITGKIQEKIIDAGKGFDIHIVEVGGTVGDYEGLHFIEAIRQMRRKVGRENVLYAHLVYLPYLDTSQELKTKPAQSSVRDLLSLGIHAQIIGCRADYDMEPEHLHKIALFSDVDDEAVVPLPTISSVYEVPRNLEKAGLGEYICKMLELPNHKPMTNGLEKYLTDLSKTSGELRIGLIAKYMSNTDTYKSVNEAIQAASVANGKLAKTIWIDAEKIEKNGTKVLEGLDGIIIPGGFGNRGTLGKIMSAQYARENNVPYLGLCLGMQIATIEFARNVIGWQDADSEEFAPAGKYNVIHIMPEQKAIMDKDNYGATMRLGAYPCVLDTESRSFALYGERNISERHRHRFEFNNDHREEFTKRGMIFAGLSPDHHLVEIIEIPEHKFYVAVQFHPEFKSRPGKPHPLFDGFVKAMLG